MRPLLVVLFVFLALPCRAAEAPPPAPEAFVQRFYARYTAGSPMEDWIRRVDAQADCLEAELLRDLRDAWQVSARPDLNNPDVLDVEPFTVVFTQVDAVKVKLVSGDAQRAFVDVQVVSRGRSTPLTLVLLAGPGGWQIGNVTYAHGVDLQGWLRRVNRR